MHTTDRGGILLVSHDHADDSGQHNEMSRQITNQMSSRVDTYFTEMVKLTKCRMSDEGRFESDCVGGQEYDPIESR